MAAKEIANGNLDIQLECKTNDEIGMLTESIKETAKQLKVKIDYINSLAYFDKLTGIKNNTAYLGEVSKIKEEMQKTGCEFSIFVIDVNGLKYVNDKYGHDWGNELIILASKVLKNCFGYEMVYRIGGDEFAVLIRDISNEDCDALVDKFQEMVTEYNGKIQLSAAIGYAVYAPAVDNDYEDVTKNGGVKVLERN